MSTLLHEMCHAYDHINICDCPGCATMPKPDGQSDHGNFWLYLASLVEEEANRVFGAFDLGRADASNEERKLEDATRR